MRALVSCLEDIGDLRNACLQRVNLVDAYTQVGHHTEAVARAREALAESEHMHLSMTSSMARYNLARALAEIGELAEALTVVREAIAEVELVDNRRLECALRRVHSMILLRSGDSSAAEEAALTGLAAGPAAPFRAFTLAQLARALLAQGRLEEAGARSEEAAALLAELGSIDDGEALIRLVRAEVLLALDESRRASEVLEEARDKLLSKANTMKSPRFRSLFLEKVPENASTLALAARWCKGVAADSPR